MTTREETVKRAARIFSKVTDCGLCEGDKLCLICQHESREFLSAILPDIETAALERAAKVALGEAEKCHVKWEQAEGYDCGRLAWCMATLTAKLIYREIEALKPEPSP